MGWGAGRVDMASGSTTVLALSGTFVGVWACCEIRAAATPGMLAPPGSLRLLFLSSLVNVVDFVPGLFPS